MTLHEHTDATSIHPPLTAQEWADLEDIEANLDIEPREALRIALSFAAANVHDLKEATDF